MRGVTTQSDDENGSDSNCETDENKSGSESDQDENEENIGDDEEEVKDEFVKTPSNDSDETKITKKAEGDKDEEIDYTTSQLYDDGNENPEILQAIEDAYVILYTVLQKTKVPVTSSSHSFDLASKFLKFSYIPNTDAKIVSPMDVHIHHEVPSKQTLSLLMDPLHTQVTTLVDDHLDARLGATRDEFMNCLSSSITARVTDQVKIHLLYILPKEVSNLAPLVIQSIVTKSLEHAVLAKESSQPQSSYKAAATLIEFELKKIMINKMDKSESYLAAPEQRECYEGLKNSYDLDKTIFSTYGKVYSLKRSRQDKDKNEDPSTRSDRWLKKRKTSKGAKLAKGLKAKESQSGSSKSDKSQSKSSRKSVQTKESEFEVADSDMPQDQEENPGNDDKEPKEKTPQQGQNQRWLMTLASSIKKPSKTFDELMSTPIDLSAFIMNGLKINNLTQETLLGLAFRLLKGTCSNYAKLQYDFEKFMSRNHQKVPVEYFFNNDLKYLQGGVLTMTYMTSIIKTKAAHYDLPGIEDMVLNIRVPVKVAYDKHIMRKHGYGYLQEIVVRRANNDLYKFKEGDFPRLHINDIKDMLLFFVQNRLTNLSGNDVSNFPETTKSGIKKRDLYTSYQDPQGFIYVDNNRRNRLMRSDELYKFSDRTSTRLRTSLVNITKKIRMEYMPKSRWSTLEKKRANILIKEIDKQLKERRLMRSLEKFVGGRHYKTDLRLLQRII
ncbi:hypothetical protein Tco_1088444 [Tanacetum coccineum]